MIFRQLLIIRYLGMGWFGQGHIDKGHYVQGMQHPRIFGRGNIGQGRTNIAPDHSGMLDWGKKNRQMCKKYKMAVYLGYYLQYK
jgi:hypothetical protein